MRKPNPSGGLSSPDESGSDGENADSDGEELNEEIEPSEEEPVEEDSSEEPSEEELFEDDPTEELVEEESIENATVEEEASEGPYEEPSQEGPSEMLDCKVFSDQDNDRKPNSRLIETNSAEKKRSVDTGETLFYSRKKCKKGQPPKPGSYSGLPSSDLGDRSGISEGSYSNENTPKESELAQSSGKKRRSRWDTEHGGDAQAFDGDDAAKKQRKTRWAGDDTQLKMLGPIQLPDFVNGLLVAANNPEIQELYQKLIEINRKLQSQVIADDQPGEVRSSPLPICNELGIRINTREVTFRAQLIHQRQEIIRELIHIHPTFKPPSDYKPQKLYKKLYIPVKEYPGYNFVGLIIGPCGNNQKRMEKKSGARILLRGKGSVREGKAPQKGAKPDPSENEDLHVLVEADNQKSLDAAVGMVEKLLVPVEEGTNLLKQAQLRELAELRGKMGFKIDAPCDICGDASHHTVSCPLTASTLGNKTDGVHVNFFSSLGGAGTSPFSGPPVSSSSTLGFNPSACTLPSYNSVPCDICGDAGHRTVSCPLTAPTAGSKTDGNLNFFSLGGTGLSPFSGPPVSSVVTMGFSPSVGILPYNNKVNKEVDNANLYVGYLPSSVDERRLVELFSTFGMLSHTKVIRDKATGLSKGYGFVKYTDPVSAAKAVEQMNGYRIDGKMLAVRVAGFPQVVPAGMGLMRPTSIGHLPMYPGPAAVVHQISGPTSWPGPPGSMLPDAHDLFPRSDGTGLHNDFSFKPAIASYGTPYTIPMPSSSLVYGDIEPPGELAQFPGNPNNFDSHLVRPFGTSQFHRT